MRSCLGFQDIEALPGKSSRSPDGFNTYLILRHNNHKYGAIAYVTPSNGSVGLRLYREDVEGSEHAISGESKDRYQVRVNLHSSEAMEEAIRLAKLAYERVL